MHYSLTERGDTPFWDYCRNMKLPDSLIERIELYRQTGRIRTKAGELFNDLSWFYIFEGMGVRPASYDPLMDVVPSAQLREIFEKIAQLTRSAATQSASHDSQFAARAAAQTAGRIASA
jgi:tryptophan halogenase